MQTDARGQRGVYASDAANRLTQIQYGPCGAALASVEETLSFGYDEAAGGAGAIGRLTHADVSGAYGANHLAYRYDAFGRVTQKTQQLEANAALVTSRHFNAKGQKDQTILASGAVIGYSYGGYDVATGGVYASNIGYAANGTISRPTYDNGGTMLRRLNTRDLVELTYYALGGFVLTMEHRAPTKIGVRSGPDLMFQT